MPAAKNGSGYGCYVCICGIFLIILGFGLGCIIGYFVVSGPALMEQLKDATETVSAFRNISFLVNVFNTSFGDNFDADFQQFKNYHYKSDNLVSDYTYQKLKEFGLDFVEKDQFNIFLPQENPENPNILKLLDKNGNIIFETSLISDSNKTVNSPYSLSSTVKAPVVYVNYADKEDFFTLLENKINLKNRIFVARCGKIHLQNMIENSEENGAQALLIYEDSLTPIYPVYTNILPIERFSDEKRPGKLPVQYVSNKTVQTIFRLDPKGPLLKNVLEKWNYPISFEPQERSKNYKLLLHINNELINKTIMNAYGRIDGAVEPDRYVILGNYHDYGEVEDLDNGTKSLLELVETFAHLKDNGWRPRRNIIFVNFDARNYGLIASREWLKNYLLQYSSKAVVYINLGKSSNLTKTIMVSKSVNSALVEALNLTTHINEIIHKNETNQNLLQNVKRSDPKEYHSEENYEMPGGFSETSPFVYYSGIPSVDFTSSDLCCEKPGPKTNITSSELCRRRILAITLNFADSRVVPLDLTLLARHMVDAFDSLFSYDSIYKNILYKYRIDLGNLRKSVIKFQDSVYEFYKMVRAIGHNISDIKSRIISDKLVEVEKMFIWNQNFVEPYFRHSLFVPKYHNYMEVTCFYGIVNYIQEVDGDNPAEINKLRMIISGITDSINRAGDVLQNVRFL